MTVYELSPDQMSCLKNALYYGCHEKSSLDIEEQKLIDSLPFWDQIPDGIVYAAFSGYDFVPGDFGIDIPF